MSNSQCLALVAAIVLAGMVGGNSSQFRDGLVVTFFIGALAALLGVMAWWLVS